LDCCCEASACIGTALTMKQQSRKMAKSFFVMLVSPLNKESWLIID
jgi:hypothetical protein